MVTRESEWGESSQQRAMELTDYEESMCRCGCGQPVTVAADAGQAFRVDVATCYAGRAREQEARKRREAAKRENRPEGWDDGQHLVVSPVDVDDLRGGAAHG